MTWELEFLLWIQDALNFAWLKPVMVFFTCLGSAGLIWLAAAGYVFVRKKEKKQALTILLALLFSAVIVNLIIKNIFARPRPFEVYPYVEVLIHAPLDYSFPSGHTSASFAAACVLSHFYPKKAFGWWGLAGMIAFSRLFLFVHFPTDVLAGMVIGIACGLLALECCHRDIFAKWLNNHQQ